MKICILRETKMPADTRVALTPGQCRMLEEKFHDIKIVVEPSPLRCFPDASYLKEGITVSGEISECDLFLGVKEVAPENLIPGKTYLFFSHTIKRQEHNKKLLKAILEKGIRLIDYEMLTDAGGSRIIGFGRWAGLIGSYLGIRACCIREAIHTLPFVKEFSSFSEMASRARVQKLPRLRVVITGDGRVGSGVCEMMDYFRIRRVTPDEFVEGTFKFPVYTQLSPGLYNKRKNGDKFDLLHFFSNPQEYESDFRKYVSVTDVLIAAAYWDPRAPRLFGLKQVQEPDFRIKVIADISCDLNGSIPTTLRTTTFDEPYYDFSRIRGEVRSAFSDSSNITVMAIDNLPCGLPAEASADFGQTLINQIFPLLTGGDSGNIIKRATIASEGKLTEAYEYLQDWIQNNDQMA